MDDLDALFRAGLGKARKRQRNSNDDNPVAAFVREQRVLQGMTQAELAERSSVPLATLRSIEQGKPTMRMDTLNKILGFFNHQVGVIHKHPRENV